jgi:hypothetical protein
MLGSRETLPPHKSVVSKFVKNTLKDPVLLCDLGYTYVYQVNGIFTFRDWGTGKWSISENLEWRILCSTRFSKFNTMKFCLLYRHSWEGNNRELWPKRKDIYLDSADVLYTDGRRFASVITRCAAVSVNPSLIVFVVRIFTGTAMNTALLIFPIIFDS